MIITEEPVDSEIKCNLVTKLGSDYLLLIFKQVRHLVEVSDFTYPQHLSSKQLSCTGVQQPFHR